MQRGQGCLGLFHILILLSVTTALSGTWSCTKTVQPDMPRPVPDGVRFTLLAPGAKNVFLVGSFNGWTKGATPMKAMAGDRWAVIVPLKTGEYTFMYLVDGVQWVTPPQAEDFVTDGFGLTNGVVVIR